MHKGCLNWWPHSSQKFLVQNIISLFTSDRTGFSQFFLNSVVHKVKGVKSPWDPLVRKDTDNLLQTLFVFNTKIIVFILLSLWQIIQATIWVSLLSTWWTDVVHHMHSSRESETKWVHGRIHRFEQGKLTFLVSITVLVLYVKFINYIKSSPMTVKIHFFKGIFKQKWGVKDSNCYC